MLTVFLVLLAAILVWYVWELQHRKTRAMPGGLDPSISLPHATEWELYHNDFSLCSKKTRVCLAELGIPYTSHHIDLIETGSYETLSRRFLKVNPGAIVPVLVHNGHPIYESHDQLAYAATHSEKPALLVPDDPDKRHLMDEWVHKSSIVGDDPFKAMDETAGNAIPGLTVPMFSAMVKYIPVHRIFEGLLFHRLKIRALLFLMLKLFGLGGLPRLKPLADMMRQSQQAMHAHLDDLESVLAASDGPWIVGEQFTLADVGMMVIFDRLREGDWLDMFLTDNRPQVRGYWEALRNRPSYDAGVFSHQHPLVVQGTKDIVGLKASNARFHTALMGA